MAEIETFSSRASISGYVTDAATGRGVALATVALLPTGLSTRTREDGFFFFVDLLPGSYTLDAAAPHLSGRYGAVSVLGVEVKADGRSPSVN
jgi:Carboxypeptidase regulatory-like domain